MAAISARFVASAVNHLFRHVISNMPHPSSLAPRIWPACCWAAPCWIPVAILNPKDAPRKVADVRCIAFHGGTQENFQNLWNLIAMALDWLNAEFDRRHASLLAQLEAEDYDNLASLPPPTYTVPTAAEVRRKR
jgi:hypothetical protein